MALWADIEKRIYVNNRRFDVADTESVSVTLSRWGAVPGMMEFRINAHFDSPAKDNGGDLYVGLRHLDNIKLFVAPRSAGVAWPSIYTGPSTRGPVDDRISKYLAWQGVYVDPELNYLLDDDSLGQSESHSISCYDYRWCVNRCLFRTPPLTKRVWESGATAVDESNWTDSPLNVFGYSFSYNEFAGPCSDEDGKTWVMIAEHIIKSASTQYSGHVVQIGDRMIDPGSVRAHIPDYSLFGFDIRVAWMGLRLESDYSELSLETDDVAGDYTALDGADSTPYGPEGNDRTGREFVPDPINIGGGYVLDALQNVVDSVGTFDMFLDQWINMHFVREKGPGEIADPDESLPGNVQGDVYLVRFAEDKADRKLTADELRYCNCRGIGNLRPRAVPSANRVVGVLQGKSPVSHAIINNNPAAPQTLGAGSVTFYADTIESNVKNQARTGYHRSEKIFYAVGRIAKPYLSAYKHKTIVPASPSPEVVTHLYSGPSGLLLKTGSLSITVASGQQADSDIQTKITRANGIIEIWQYVVLYTLGMANVRVQKNKNEDVITEGDKDKSGGGHYIALAEPAYSAFNLIEEITRSGGGELVKTQTTTVRNVYITHSWSARGTTSKHRQQYVNNSDASVEDGVCVNNMGIAQASEVFTIDSSFQGAYNDWSKASDIDSEDLREYDGAGNLTFPGLGEYTRSVIDAQPITKTVRALVPTNTAVDDYDWNRKWQFAIGALKRQVKIEAESGRQLVTEGTQPVLYDSELKLWMRVCIFGTRDDAEEGTEDWKRLNSMKARIRSIRLLPGGDIELELTDELALQEFSLLEYARRM